MALERLAANANNRPLTIIQPFLVIVEKYRINILFDMVYYPHVLLPYILIAISSTKITSRA